MTTIEDADVKGKRVLVRADFNVPVEDGEVGDDTRIRKTLPTLEHLREREARVIVCAHLGRPKGEPEEEFRMDPVAKRLSELLGARVRKLDDCVGEAVEQAVGEMSPGDVVLLENTRFHPEEKENDEDFAKRLATLADLYVSDAFGAAHRAHASTEGVAHHLPAFAGLLMEREVRTLESVRENPGKPFVAILGGAKISDKIGVIDSLLEQADHLLIGGGMANTFLKARGKEIGESLVEEDSVDDAKRILDRAGDRVVLPVDVVIADEFDADAERRTVSADEVPERWRILDVGPETVERFRETLKRARTVVWNGPLGAFELKPFARGSHELARALAEMDATVVVGGGETATAVEQAGVTDRLTHVSTGGGAFLEFMEGKDLPGIRVLTGGGRS